MKQGLYRIHFHTAGGASQAMGAGVVSLRDGRVSGGDSNFYYTGAYHLDGTKVTVHATVLRHTNEPGSRSIFGTDTTKVTLTGSADIDGQIRAFGVVDGAGIQFQVALKWLAE